MGRDPDLRILAGIWCMVQGGLTPAAMPPMMRTISQSGQVFAKKIVIFERRLRGVCFRSKCSLLSGVVPSLERFASIGCLWVGSIGLLILTLYLVKNKGEQSSCYRKTYNAIAIFWKSDAAESSCSVDGAGREGAEGGTTNNRKQERHDVTTRFMAMILA